MRSVNPTGRGWELQWIARSLLERGIVDGIGGAERLSGLLVIIGAAWFIGGVGVLFLGLRPFESLVLRMYLGFAACAVLILAAGSYLLGVVTYLLGFCMVASAGVTRLLRSREAPMVEPEAPSGKNGILEWGCLGCASQIIIRTGIIEVSR